PGPNRSFPEREGASPGTRDLPRARGRVDPGPGRFTVNRTAVRPRLCLVVGYLGRGRLEKQAFLLGRGLMRRGFYVAGVPLPAGGALARALNQGGIPVLDR